MMIEFQIENMRPDICVSGIGLFHHWWLHIKLAYYRLMLKMFDDNK